MDETAEIRIRIRFSKNLDKSVKKAINKREIKSKAELINKLVGIYQNNLKTNKNFIRPLKAIDKHVKVTVESVMIGEE